MLEVKMSGRHGRNGTIISLFRLQRGLCYICRGPMTLERGNPNTATKDHIIPKSRLHIYSDQKKNNIKAACAECNRKKADYIWPGLDDLRSDLYVRIRTPTGDVVKAHPETAERLAEFPGWSICKEK